jgi:2-polyprenyl-3-methyl-5-hydroxy-6-metoxy-1,4-benzoquinol methylase
MDRNPEIISVAKERHRTGKLGNIEFEEASVEDYSDPELFDAVIGLYVLIHESDPVALIHAAPGLDRCPGQTDDNHGGLA